MASPPPSGPTQPPYQPYPQQPYPPSYPPQQPYYAPAAPPPKPDHTVLYIVVAVVVVIVVIGLLSLYFFFIAVNTANQFTKITITGVSFTISYNGVDTGYFGGNQITSCPACPITVSLYTRFTYTLTLHNSDAVTHSVDTISLSGNNFQLTDVSPALPANIAAGTSTGFTLTIQPTALAGSYTMPGTIGTS